MKGDMASLGLPIVLLAALWGAVNTTLKAFQIINSRRDTVFQMIDECGLCLEHTLRPLHIYFTNVVPLTTGLCIFLFVVSFVVLSIPRYMNIDDEDYAKRMCLASRLIAVLPLFALMAFIGGGIFDAVMIARSL